MGNQVTAEHGLHGEAGFIAQLGHVGGGGAAADALVGGAVDQAAVEYAVALAAVEAAVFQKLGGEDVVVIDAVGGE